MAHLGGPAADRTLAYYRRAKRRTKRDLAEFTRQGITPLAPFAFGDTPANGFSANTLTLPADGRFVLELDAAVITQDYAITGNPGVIFNVDAGVANSRIAIRSMFRRAQGITIFRAVTCPAGALNIYFDDQFGKLTLIGTAVFT